MGAPVTDDRETPRWEASWALTVGVDRRGDADRAGAGDVRVDDRPCRPCSVCRRATSSAGIVVPPLIAATIFWFAGSQDRIDRRFDGLES